MRSTAQIGMKISAAQREYCRYTGISAEMERLGLGSSRADRAWALRSEQKHTAKDRTTTRKTNSR